VYNDNVSREAYRFKILELLLAEETARQAERTELIGALMQPPVVNAAGANLR
jgi:hypothetical protein